MFKKIAILTALAATTSVSALSVLVPSSDWWWQNGDTALLQWDCRNLTSPSQSQFAVVAHNPSQTLLPDGYTILVGIQNNDQCMTNIVPNLNPGTGYYLTLTNIVNYTDVYATSETFEVKTKGSPYPTQSPPAIPFYGTTSGSEPNPTDSSPDDNTDNAARIGMSIGGALAVLGGLTVFLGV